MMIRLRFFASSSGSAEMPSRSGISMSSTATSGSTRSIWLTASRPVRSDAATTMSGSASIQREINPLITTESSTTITRSGSCRVEFEVEELANATLINHQTRRNSTTEQTAPTTVRPPDRKTHDQIRPTSWNFAVTMSLSNGFMMYSLAPA